MRQRVLLVVLAGALAIAATACSEDQKETKYPDRCGKPAAGVEWARCNLRDADLKGADLSSALIHDVDLAGADLTGADLSNATLVNVQADGAKLKDANLEGATVNGGDIHLAIYCNTKMPDGQIANSGC